MKKKNLFTVPKLCNRGNNLAKYWYVYFTYYFVDNGEQKSKQFRYKADINTFKTKRDREREAGSMITVLHNRLLSGWNPILDTITVSMDSTLSEAFDDILSIKKSFLTKRSYKTYFDQVSLFKKWLKLAKYDHLFVQNFNKSKAQQYLDWLLRDNGY